MSVEGNCTWDELYSGRGENLRQSEIRALFSVVSRPEVVSLAGGMPNLSDLPLNQIAESTARLLETDGGRALQYGDGIGWDPLRQQIIDVMRHDGIEGEFENVVITTGSQQALDLVTELFVDPGDVILAESPSYVGALGVFRAHQADVVQVEMDDDGLIPSALEDAIAATRAAGGKIKFLYTVPNYNNPAGVTLSDQRRDEIIEICKRAQVLIVEDNPYGLLGFEADSPDALQSRWPEGVIYLGSFSKMFAPGYRIGWSLMPPALTEKMSFASEAAILSPSMMGQMSISRYLKEFDWYTQVKQFRGMYQERWLAMREALEEYLEGCTWTEPTGGFYTWVTLPEGIDAKEMLPRAVENLVAYVPGTAFYYDGRGRDKLRLSFCYPTPENIREGVRRLGETIKAELAASAN